MATTLPLPRDLALKLQTESSKCSSILIYEGQTLVTAKVGNLHEPLVGGAVAGHVKRQPESSNFLPCRQVTAFYTGAPVLSDIWGSRSWRRCPPLAGRVIRPYDCRQLLVIDKEFKQSQRNFDTSEGRFGLERGGRLSRSKLKA